VGVLGTPETAVVGGGSDNTLKQEFLSFKWRIKEKKNLGSSSSIKLVGGGCHELQNNVMEAFARKDDLVRVTASKEDTI